MKHITMLFLGTVVCLLTAGSNSGNQSLGWRLVSAHDGPMPLFSNKGAFYSFFVLADSIGGRFGPVTVWRPEDRRSLVPVSQSLSGLDEAFRAEGNGGGERAVKLVLEYIRLYRGFEQGFVLTSEGTDRYIKNLRDHMDSQEYHRILSSILPPKTKIESSEWEVAFTVVTWRGAIERRTYGGTSNPASVRKELIEVTAPYGSVPSFAFNPDP